MPYGVGSIYQRKDGHWMAAVELSGPNERTRRRRSFTAATREAVEQRLAEYRTTNPAPDWYDGTSRAERVAAADGSHTDREFAQLVRDRGTACEYCGTLTFIQRGSPSPVDRVRDHRTPLVRGGSNDIANIAVSCRGCNDSKGKKTVEEFVAWREA